ncbi:MAG: amino acid adenylation domain-containing protein [Cyanobacteria bacterium P01_D01_bin.156]
MNAVAAKRNSIEDIYPLSPMQQGLLFHTLLSPAAGAYVPQVVVSFSGSLDSQLLQQAWQTILERHSILRTGFYWEQRDQPFQVVQRSVALPWVEQDWSSLSATEQASKLTVLLECNRNESFNLSKPPLMRLTWVSLGKGDLGEERYHLIWCYHHLILDGWSSSQLLKEVFQQYFILTGTLPSLTATPAKPYGEYIAWLNQQDKTAAQNFWETYLSNWQGPTALPILQTERPQTGSLEQQQYVISAEATQVLRDFIQRYKITLNTLIQGALGLLLSRYTNSHDVVFGATCAGRPTELAGSLSMVGLFINTLPVRVQVKPQATAASWLQDLVAQQTETITYEYVSLRELQAWSNDGRSLFDCLLVFESYPVATDMFQGQTAFKLDDIQFNEWTHFPLTLLVSEGKELAITAKYRSEQISPEAITRLLGHLNNVLLGLAQHPKGNLQDIDLLSATEKQQLTEWNLTQANYPLGQVLPNLLALQAKKSPSTTAVIFEDQALTYQELHQKANQLAHHLQSQGIASEHRVGIYFQRALGMTVAILAVIKAGAAYVPLDPEYPAARLHWMLEDADITAVIIDKLLNLPPLPDTVVTIDVTDGSQQPSTEPKHGLTHENSAYNIYTSGSTGKPKGVINTHRGLVNRLCWMQEAYGLTEEERILQKTPLSFDVSVWELFWPLLNGATLVIAKPGGHRDSTYLAKTICQQQITTVHFVPSMLAAFLEDPDVSTCTSLRRVICSGEALSPALQKQFFEKLPNTELHNLYGPTEAAIDVTAWQCQPGEATVPIGRPIANTQIHLLDQDNNSVPIGIPGELHIGGAGVARGYLNRPELTAERFITNPFFEIGSRKLEVGSNTSSSALRSPSSVLYKTGDLARYRPDGAIEYLGRKDFQVKLRGMRIELGEIEAALNDYPGVQQSVVLLQDDVAGGPALVAYLVGIAVGDLKLALTAFLKQRLTEAMIPKVFISMESMPLTSNGKLDRRALPQPEQMATVEKVLPRNRTETDIAAIWQDILQTDAIGIYENFFELGGHSLTATRMNTRLRKQFELNLPLHSVFEYPTIEVLAVHIDALRIAAKPTESPTGHKEIEL